MTNEQRQLLKQRLKANRWNLYHLADHAGITKAYLSRIIRNVTPASTPVKISLALHATGLTDFPYDPSDFDLTNTSTEN